MVVAELDGPLRSWQSRVRDNVVEVVERVSRSDERNVVMVSTHLSHTALKAAAEGKAEAKRI